MEKGLSAKQLCYNQINGLVANTIDFVIRFVSSPFTIQRLSLTSQSS